MILNDVTCIEIEEIVYKNIETNFGPYAWKEIPVEHLVKLVITAYSDQLRRLTIYGEKDV